MSRPPSLPPNGTRRTVPRPLTLVVAAGAIVSAATGCAPDHQEATPAASTAIPWSVPPTSAVPRPTLPPPPRHPDTRGVQLPVLADAATPPVVEPLEIYGGEAELSGSLGYLGEPVEGATVRLERWVDGRSTFVELTTGPGGGWLARDIHGGRYVIRAWKGSRLVLEQASAVFMAEDEERAVHLAMVEVYVPPVDEDDDDADDDDADDEDDTATDLAKDDPDDDTDGPTPTTTTTSGGGR